MFLIQQVLTTLLNYLWSVAKTVRLFHQQKNKSNGTKIRNYKSETEAKKVNKKTIKTINILKCCTVKILCCCLIKTET